MKERVALETFRGENASNAGSCESHVTRVTSRNICHSSWHPTSLGTIQTANVESEAVARSLYSREHLTVVSVSWWLLHNSFTNCHAGYILQPSLLCHMCWLAQPVLPQRPEEVWEWNTTDSTSQEPVSRNICSFLSRSCPQSPAGQSRRLPASHCPLVKKESRDSHRAAKRRYGLLMKPLSYAKSSS